MKRGLLLALFALGLSGCWVVERSESSIEFSLKEGSGRLSLELFDLTCENEGKPCPTELFTKESAGLQRARNNYEKILKGLGVYPVKTTLVRNPKKESYRGSAKGQFRALTQLPNFDSLTFKRKETDGGPGVTRYDLELHFEIRRGEVALIGKTAQLSFVSLDKGADILAFSPEGKLDPKKTRITWIVEPNDTRKTVPFSVTLKGPTVREN